MALADCMIPKLANKLACFKGGGCLDRERKGTANVATPANLWRAVLCLSRASFVAPFGPSSMCFLATARRLGCQCPNFRREAPLISHI